MTESFKLTMFTYKTTIYEPVQAHKALLEAWNWVKPMVMAGHRLNVVIKPETRSTEQNKKLHAMLTDIANQVEWHGKKFDVIVWKRLCVASWLREQNQTPNLIPALDGNGFDVIYEKTAKLTVTQCSNLIEWCFAFGVEYDVEFRDMEKND